MRPPDPRRSSLEKPSTDNEAANLVPDEAPTEEQERALALLQRSNFFKSLEPAVLSELPRLATFIEAPKGAVVFRQGDPASNCWLIAKGEVGFYTSHTWLRECDGAIAMGGESPGENAGWYQYVFLAEQSWQMREQGSQWLRFWRVGTDG